MKLVQAILFIIPCALVVPKEFRWKKPAVVLVEIDQQTDKAWGNYPYNRFHYVELADALKRMSPNIIFFDFFFIKKPESKSDNFANRLNRKKKVITSMVGHEKPFFANEDAEALMDFKMSCGKISFNPGLREFFGISFPYYDLVQNSRSTVLSFVGMDNGKAIYIEPYAFYKNHYCENAPLAIVNLFLETHHLTLVPRADFREIKLCDMTDNLKNCIPIMPEIDKNAPLLIPIKYGKVRRVSALDILNGRAKGLMKNESIIFIVGLGIRGVGDRWYTPNGYASGASILSNEVETILSLIHKAILKQKKNYAPSRR